jgi:hypothetical protein
LGQECPGHQSWWWLHILRWCNTALHPDQNLYVERS